MAEYDPNDGTVEEVNAYLADADDTEKARVLEAEKAGQARVGIVGHDDDAKDSGPDVPADASDTKRQAIEAGGLAQTGNPLDLSERLDPSPHTNADLERQDVPADVQQKWDEATSQGFIGTPNPAKPDLSQANPDVMNQGN